MTAHTQSDQKIKLACVQMRSGIDRQQNILAATSLIEEAAGQGAHFIATPEMTNVVDRKPDRLFSNLPTIEGLVEVDAFAKLADRLGIWLLIGSMAVKVEGPGENGRSRAYNRAFLFGPNGQIVARYDKIHMFDVRLPGGETWQESAIYKPGEEALVVPTPFAKLGLSICYDVRFPALYRQMAAKGAQILCVPAAFTRQTGRAHWETLLRARAIECMSFVIAPAQGGDHEDGRETWGHSMIISPWGEILAEKKDDHPGIILAEIDLDEVKKARERIPSLDLECPYTVLT